MLTPKQKQEIYDLLAATFDIGKPIMVAQAGNCLAGHGYRAKDLGYKGLNKMLEDMSEYVLFQQAHTEDGNPFWQITLKPRKKEKKNAKKKYPDDIRAFAYLPGSTLEIFHEKIHHLMKKDDTPLQMLSTAYQTAVKQNRITEKDDTCTFPTELKNKDGEVISVFFARNTRKNDTRPWALTRVYEGKPNPEDFAPLPSEHANPGDALEDFAVMGNWVEVLRVLADMALPEQWDFQDSKVKNFYILRQYLKYTFLRLKHEEKVLTNHDQTFAAFNTGLLTIHYDDIYACFEKNHDPNSTIPWRFSSFCTEGSRGDGQRITIYFAQAPQPPSYISEVSDLLYDTRRRLAVNYDHILSDNIGRMPLAYLRDACNRYPEALAIIDKAAKCRFGSSAYNRHMRDLATFCEEKDNAFISERIRSDVKRAIDKATKRIRWDYKTAVPIYYPAYNLLSLMIPLCLDSDHAADVALLVEKTESGNYLGHTILTLPMAYLDARLLCRPNSDWLQPNLISDAEDD